MNIFSSNSLFFSNFEFVFFSVEDTPVQVSPSEDFTIPEETLEQHQESNKEIRITVKEEEEDVVNSKQNPVTSLLKS